MNSLVALFFTVGFVGASAHNLPRQPQATAAQTTTRIVITPRREARLRACALRRERIELTDRWLHAMRRPAGDTVQPLTARLANPPIHG